MEEICVLIAKDKRKYFKRYDFSRKIIDDFGIALNIYTIYNKKSAITKRRLKKICSKYTYIYSNDACFKKYCKSKEESLFNYMPNLLISELTKDDDFSEKEVGLVIKSGKLVNINFLSGLLRKFKYINIYNSSKESKKAILDATGICVKEGKDYTEELIIYLGENLSFFINGIYITDASLKGHSFLDETDLPAQEIIKDCLKQKDCEKIMEKTGIFINNLLPLDKTY